MSNPIPTTLLECASEFAASGKFCQLQEADSKSEIKRVESDELYRNNVLTALFPNGMDTTVSALTNLWQFSYGTIHQSCQTSGQPLGYLFSFLFIQLMNTSPQEWQTAFLATLISKDNSDFWSQIVALCDMFHTAKLPARVLIDWFPVCIAREGSDMTAGNAYRMAFNYARQNPDAGLDILTAYLREQLEEPRLTLAKEILAALRLSANKSEATHMRVLDLENQMAKSPREDWRCCFHLSWGSTLTNQPFDVNLFQEKLATMLAGTQAERNVAFMVACQWMGLFARTLKANDALAVGLRWLQTNADSDLADVAKHNIVCAFYFLTLTPVKNIDEPQVNALLEITQKIQPIPLKNKGTWNYLKQLSAQCIDKVKTEKWIDLWECMSEQNPTELLTTEFSHNDRVLFWCHIKKAKTSGVITRLLFHRKPLMRRYGCEFLAKVETGQLDDDFISSLPDKCLLIGVLSMGLNAHDEKTLHRFLLAIAPHLVAINDSELKKQALHEMVLWLINYPGALLNDETKTALSRHPALVDAIKQAEAYFDALKAWRQSPINAFRRYELDRSAILARRESATSMRKAVEKDSLLSLLTNGPISVLYGDRFANHYAGKVSESAPFQNFSSRFELPRLSLIDPDGEFFRRNNTRQEIEELESL